MSRKPRCSIDVADWPALDRQLWDAALRPGVFLDRPGEAAHWRPATVQQRAKGYGLLLFHLGAIGALDPDQRPDRRLTERTVTSFVQSLRDRDLASVTVAARVTDVEQTLRVMVPDGDLDLIRRARSQLDKLAEPTRDKASKVINSKTLLREATRFLNQIDEAEAINDLVRATLYRDALVVALLAACPIRLANLTSMTIDRHLVRLDDGYGCRFGEEETKERRRLSFPLPNRLVPFMKHYLTELRPRLLRNNQSERLWIGIRAKPIAGQTIYCAVGKMTERLFGQPLSPHLFRDCAATTIAIEAPESVRLTASILGHRTPRMSEKHYNQAQMIESSRTLQHTLVALLDEAEAED